MKKDPTGYVLHEGFAENGEPFFVVATLESKNAKTGNMIQVWIMLRDVNPIAAVEIGLDSRTVCRGCAFASGRGCYVDVSKAPLSVWKAFRRGGYSHLPAILFANVFAGRSVRFGAYGNPSLIPLRIVRDIVDLCDSHTGYFHDWRTNPLADQYSDFFMASTETEQSLKAAQILGFRVFHVSPVQPMGSIECLSARTGGRVQCADCKLNCDGRDGRHGKRAVWINPHGGAGRAERAAKVALSDKLELR